jgi:enoyl-CoA hydratase
MSDVIVQRQGLVQVVTLNRPEARNALNGSVARHVMAAMDELDSSDELAVGVLTGAGGSFSSGMDLKAFLVGDTAGIPGRGLCGIVETPPRKPLIAAVEGWAVGGGFELLLACDLVVAASTARFALPEVRRGLVAGAGGAVLLSRRIPQAIALEFLLTGSPVTAERAHAIGLVNHVVDEGAALDGALKLAASIAGNGPLAVAVTKQLAHESTDWSFSQCWANQDPAMRMILDSEDAKEGARAFAEKRPPVWRGR